VRPHVKERSRIVSYVGIRSCIFTRLKPQNMELLCSNLLFYRRTACMPLGKRLQENVHSEQKKKKYGGEVWQSARRAGGWGEKNKANSTVELTSLPRRSIASPGCTFCSSSVSRAHTASLDKEKTRQRKKCFARAPLARIEFLSISHGCSMYKQLRSQRESVP